MERVASNGRSWGMRLAVVALVILAYWLGTQRPAVAFHVGEAHSAEGAVTIEAGGWSYGMEPIGVTWIDAQGFWHEGSDRPSCLPPGGTTDPVRFGAVQVTVNDLTWRPIIVVDCSYVAP